jgi:hypothetical protein
VSVDWHHLSTAHGFAEWTYDEFADMFPSFVSPGGGIEVAAFHKWDHQLLDPADLEHEHEQVTRLCPDECDHLHAGFRWT